MCHTCLELPDRCLYSLIDVLRHALLGDGRPVVVGVRESIAAGRSSAEYNTPPLSITSDLEVEMKQDLSQQLCGASSRCHCAQHRVQHPPSEPDPTISKRADEALPPLRTFALASLYTRRIRISSKRETVSKATP